MTFGFAMLTVGTLLLLSGVRNRSIAEVMQGIVSSNWETTTEPSNEPGSGIPAPLGNIGVSEVPGHPELKPGISLAVLTVMSVFPGLTITSTTGGTHVNNSYHPKGRAADLAGSATEMNKAARWISKYMTVTLTEGIHNPGLSVKNGKTVPPGFWGSEWAEHKDHIHLAV